ncbi:MAG: hypothetical protein K1X68_06120 [Saprospiraceae bacterium]|nr:hypothetical protein [Saprospiraceae bacterium]HMW39211.1 hypothetical protein [Saprospiraceae bacterium]HMX88965.1 hypothetical protein [Saprospiraceae bacterium]HMZ40866.1 hypothetical protein [Saprospiraceae bacterium]HNA65365.1 hypothetical protein [Saprospiraceae bacterium]
MKLALILFALVCGLISAYSVLEVIKAQKSITSISGRLDTAIELVRTSFINENRIKKDSLISKIQELEFKQDYYTKQLDIQYPSNKLPICLE